MRSSQLIVKSIVYTNAFQIIIKNDDCIVGGIFEYSRAVVSLRIGQNELYDYNFFQKHACFDQSYHACQCAVI